jgi:S1-C subfamily serine protease
MGFDVRQRGALIIEVAEGSPASEAGLQGADRAVEVLGQDLSVGGDLIIAIDDQPVSSMDDLIVYLVKHTRPGYRITLNLLRDGEEMPVDVILAPRP